MDFPDEREAKRRKLERTHGPPIEINRVEDLQNALAFRKTSSPEVKKGIQAFKDFIGSIQVTESVAEESNKVRLLKLYCDHQSPAEENGVAFADLISSWAHAGESNNDSVLSAVPAVLAQFLKFISGYLEFREFGLSLCTTLLQKDQLQLFDRAFSTSKSKEHLISPCLRLLTEVVTFDGGAFAAQLYARKDILLKRLDVFLEQTATKDDPINSRRPTLRRIAQRYVIANIKLQSTSIRGDLIGQGKILHALLKGIDRDGDDIIIDILQIVQTSVLNDKSLHKISRLLNNTNLQSLLSLYDYEQISSSDGELEDDSVPNRPIQKVRNKIHAFYLDAIQQGAGIALSQNGWYPQGMHADFFDSSSLNADIIDLGLDSPLHFDEYRDKIPVKNGTLSSFAQSLKPDSDDLQAALLLKMFEIAPELVADYFSRTKRFNRKPKDDAEWRSQSAFLFSVVQLPVPETCGWQEGVPEVPPPISIVIESLLPRAFPQADLVRCMNLAHEIITLFAAKYLTLSLQKLSKTLHQFQRASSNMQMWKEASEKLIRVFMERSPSVKNVVAAMQRSTKEDKQLRTALIECLANYFQTLPQVALSEKFDVAASILETVRKLESEDLTTEDKELLLDQVQDLCSIAERSTEARWWHKQDAATLSPLTALLRTAIGLESTTKPHKELLKLLRGVMMDHGILDSNDAAFDAFIASLTNSNGWTPDQSTYMFLDNCMIRLARQSIKYFELLEIAQTNSSEKAPLSLLACCIAEQWPFIAKADDENAKKSISSWIVRIFDAFGRSGGNLRVLSTISEEMIASSSGTARTILKEAFETQSRSPVKILHFNPDTQETAAHKITIFTSASETNVEVDLDVTFGPPSSPPKPLEGLIKWTPNSLETDIQSSRLSRLIQCTVSPLEETRTQAFSSLQSLLSQLQESTHPDAQRLHLLFGELLETMKLHPFTKPLPTILASMSTLLLRILTDPTHRMYSKANRFLLRSPRWDLAKLPSYWITQILLREADDDSITINNSTSSSIYSSTNTTNLEITSLLSMLTSGLTTPEDMELYRANAVFERCLSLWWSPHVSTPARRQICHLVWRGWRTGDAGQMTLLTRCGLRAWVDAALLDPREEDERRVLSALRSEVERVLEGEEGKEWKGRGWEKEREKRVVGGGGDIEDVDMTDQ